MVIHTDLTAPINCGVDGLQPAAGPELLYGTFKTPPGKAPGAVVKVYKKRFFMLGLFCLCTGLNGFQWIQFSIITSILSCYYDVSVESINWTSILFFVMFIPFVVPVAWMMSVKGLRITLIIAAAGNALTSCIQCLSLTPSKFYVVIISQTVAATAQCFSLSMPSYIAALWFPPKEVSLACAVGIFGNQLGVALGFLIPPLLVPNDCHDLRDVRTGLWWLALGQAVANFGVYVLIVLFFEDKPLFPPSLAEAKKPEKPDAILRSIRKMIKDIHFTMLLLVYGLLLGVFNAVSALLNQLVVKTFPGQEVAAGWIGLESVFAGMLGALLCGHILDRTNMFRQTSIAVYVLSTVAMVTYTIVSSVELLWLHFVMLGLLSCFMCGYQAIAYQFAAEIAYPEPEGTSCSLLTTVLSIMAIFMTYFGSWLQQTYGNFCLEVFFTLCCVIGCVMSVFIKCNPKRCMENQAVQQPLIAHA